MHRASTADATVAPAALLAARVPVTAALLAAPAVVTAAAIAVMAAAAASFPPAMVDAQHLPATVATPGVLATGVPATVARAVMVVTPLRVAVVATDPLGRP